MPFLPVAEIDGRRSAVRGGWGAGCASTVCESDRLRSRRWRKRCRATTLYVGLARDRLALADVAFDTRKCM